MPSIDQPPKPIDCNRYLSYESKNRKRSQLKELRPYFDMPGMISFGVGVPHPSTWPVNGMTLSIPFTGKSVYIPGYQTPNADQMLPIDITPSKADGLVPDIGTDLQYSATYGHPHLLKWLKEHITRVHSPKYDDWEVLLTAGNTDGMDAVMRTCLDKGDYFLVEEFAYPGLLSPAASLGYKTLGVPLDSEGIDPDALDVMMRDWDEEKMGGDRPKLLVVVPTCSNPGGMTIPEQRKREIYAICRKWDLLVVEDDPYCFLQIRPDGANSPIVPTFLSLDTDGRVIRIDSFSKIVAPGSRLGFITGHKALVEKLMNSRESATQCPSGFSVSAIAAILRAWGSHDGFENTYVPHISGIYAKRCHLMLDLLSKHVPSSTIELPKPSGGMFLWVRLKVETHPSLPSLSPEEISKKIFDSLIEEKVIIARSEFFKAPSLSVWTKEEEAKRIYMRLSFSLPPPEEMEEGARRMGRALTREWGL